MDELIEQFSQERNVFIPDPHEYKKGACNHVLGELIKFFKLNKLYIIQRYVFTHPNDFNQRDKEPSKCFQLPFLRSTEAESFNDISLMLYPYICSNKILSFSKMIHKYLELHPEYIDYFSYVVFPSLYCYFVTEEFTECGIKLLNEYYKEYGADRLLLSMITIIFLTQYSFIGEVKDQFIMKLNERVTDCDFDASPTAIANKIKSAFSSSISELPSVFVGFMKELLNDNPKVMVPFIVNNVIKPIIHLFEYAEEFTSTLLFIQSQKRVMSRAFDKNKPIHSVFLELDSILENKKRLSEFSTEILVSFQQIKGKSQFKSADFINSKDFRMILSFADIYIIGQIIGHQISTSHHLINITFDDAFDLRLIPFNGFIMNEISYKIEIEDNLMTENWRMLRKKCKMQDIDLLEELTTNDYSHVFIEYCIENERKYIQARNNVREQIKARNHSYLFLHRNLSMLQVILKSFEIMYASKYPIILDEHPKERSNEFIRSQKIIVISQIFRLMKCIFKDGKLKGFIEFQEPYVQYVNNESEFLPSIYDIFHNNALMHNEKKINFEKEDKLIGVLIEYIKIFLHGQIHHFINSTPITGQIQLRKPSIPVKILNEELIVILRNDPPLLMLLVQYTLHTKYITTSPFTIYYLGNTIRWLSCFSNDFFSCCSGLHFDSRRMQQCALSYIIQKVDKDMWPPFVENITRVVQILNDLPFPVSHEVNQSIKKLLHLIYNDA